MELFVFECRYSDPMSGGGVTGDGEPGVTGDTGGSGYSPPPDPPTITVSDTTPTIDTNPTISSQSSVSAGTSVRWPANAEGMEDLLGEPGRSVTDRPNTPGRGQMVWEIRSDPRMRIVGEQHPYIDEPWHWHVDPGHYRGYPGTPMPDWLVKILTELGYL